MVQQAIPERYTHTWLHFVGASCEEGKRWVKAYLRYEPVVDMNYECLVLLKQRRYSEGADHLQRFRDCVDAAANDADPATRALLERWYHAVDGYYWYCLETYDQAERAMEQAEKAIADAISHLSCLVPLASQCHEFRLHRARIARNERRWDDMWAHVNEVRGMFEGTRPFCNLSDGRPVGLADIKSFYGAFGDLGESEREAVAYVLDDDVRMRDFRRFIHEMSRIPGFVIRYP